MPRGIAIDWVAGNVYWTDSGRDVIEVAQMKGENRKTLISGMIDEPHAIVVDPLRGWAGLGGRGGRASGLGRGWHPSTPGALWAAQTCLGVSLPGPRVSPPAPLCPALPACAQDPLLACSDPGLAATWLLLGPGGGCALPADLDQHIVVLEEEPSPGQGPGCPDSLGRRQRSALLRPRSPCAQARNLLAPGVGLLRSYPCSPLLPPQHHVLVRLGEPSQD